MGRQFFDDPMSWTQWETHDTAYNFGVRLEECGTGIREFYHPSICRLLWKLGGRKLSVGKLCDSGFKITAKSSCSEITSKIGFAFAILVFQKGILVSISLIFQTTTDCTGCCGGILSMEENTQKKKKESPWTTMDGCP